MFHTDKEGSRRGGQRRGSGSSREEVLEKARRERAQREKARASRGPAIVVQRWYRGRRIAARVRSEERLDWDRKMSDFGRLHKALVARGVPFAPPVKFVLSALQQLLFFHKSEQDSARLCLFCESVLTLCISEADPSLNPAAHLVGVVGAPTNEAVGGGEARVDPAFRLRLRRLLGACLDYIGTGVNLNKGVKERNAPLKVLLMLVGNTAHVTPLSGMLEPALTPTALAARSTVARSCIEILVFELGLFGAARGVLLGGESERKVIASAGVGGPMKPSPGRQGAILGCWELTLTALDAVGTIAPPPSSISPGAHATSNTTTPFSSFYNDGATSKGAAAPAAAAALRASFVSQVLSVPLLPSRLGGGGGVGGGGVGNGSVGIGLLIRDRTECFVDCLRDFCDETMIPLEARTSTTTMPAAAGGGSGDSHCCTAADSTTKSSGGSSNNGTATAAVGRGGHRVDWRGLCDLPPPPVSCCSTETFLLGNIVAMGTNLQQSTAAAVVDDGGGKEAATGERGRGTKRRTLRKQELEFMRTVTKLLELEAIPDSLLTDRQAITWQKSQYGKAGGTSMTVLAVPQAVQNQVRLLVSDWWIRAASKRVLEGVNEVLLQRCTGEERLETKETLELSSANLAMESVRHQREETSRSFVSKWAEKLRLTGKRWFASAIESNSNSNSNRPPPPPTTTTTTTTPSLSSSPSPPLLVSGGSGAGLINSSAASRAAAKGQQQKSSEIGGGGGGGGGSGGGEGRGEEVDPSERPHSYDADCVVVLSELLSVLLRRWGTGINASNQVMQGVLNTLCFSFPCVARLWAFTDNETTSFDRLCDTAPVGCAKGGGMYATVAVVCCLFSHLLVVLDDAELYEGGGRPLPLHHVRALVRGLRRPLFKFCWEEEGQKGSAVRASPNEHFGAFLAGAAERLLRGLYVRSSRRALCRSEAWVIPQAESNRVLSEIKAMTTSRSKRLLRAMPYCMSLTQRIRVFEHLVKADKARHQPENSPGVNFRVRRGHILEDGLAVLGSGGKAERQMKRRLCVIYIGAAGHEESGIDMGGLFKDFWTDLSALAFDVNYGLFRVTKEGLMYPNPSSGMVHESDHLRLFEFLGRILGKALYEGITVQPEFATFFLGFIRGDYNFLHLFHDLHGLDPELYRNLMFLKTYNGGDVEDLCLTFAVADEAFGANKEVDLVPGGSNRAVTSVNRLEYINRVAKHHLVDGVKAQAEAFVRGLWEVIDPQWLQMFSEPELQVLISGSNKTLDVEDLKRHTRYSGGFVGMDRTMRRFWSVVDAMSAKEKAALLRFVTSCERPPPLGFESMQPPFCIHRVGISSDGERLPTASTCFNTLKLPTYSSEKVMREKLLTSIFSGTGFELS